MIGTYPPQLEDSAREHAKLIRTTTWTPGTGRVPVTWQGVEYDSRGGWLAGAPTYYYVQEPGLYIVSCQAVMNSAAGSAGLTIDVEHNGGAIPILWVAAVSTTLSVGQAPTAHVRMALQDTLRMFTTLTTTSRNFSAGFIWLAVARIGP